jgi:hypothetical protein
MNNVSLFILFFVCLPSFFAQKNLSPWEEKYTVEPYQQGLTGQVVLNVQNTGSDIDDCIIKAQKVAIYTVLFNGFPEANNIPASVALCESGAYINKKDFFDNFFNSISGVTYKNYSPKAEINPKKPVSKIDKKTIEANIIVTVNVGLLRLDLEKQNIIKSLSSFGFEPLVLVVPSDEWMEANNYIIRTNNQGKIVENRNYVQAIRDPKIGDAIAFVKNYYEKPNGPFNIADLNEKASELNDEIQKANIDGSEESIMDVFSRVVKADIWVKVDLKENKIEGGLKSQLTITLSYYDPYSGITKNGSPIIKESTNSNRAQLIKSTMQGALDELRSKIFEDFSTKESKGITGKVIFKLKTSDYDFNSEFPFKSEELTLNEIIDKVVKKKAIPSSTKTEGASSETLIKFKTNIPLFIVDNEDGIESKDLNTFKLFGSKLRSEFKKLGFTTEVKEEGLGTVIIYFTGLNQ